MPVSFILFGEGKCGIYGFVFILQHGRTVIFLCERCFAVYPPLNVKKHFKKTGKVIFLTLVWVLLILSIIKLCILPEGEMSRTEFFKTLLYLKTGYVINQYWFLLALVMLYVFFPCSSVLSTAIRLPFCCLPPSSFYSLSVTSSCMSPISCYCCIREKTYAWR